MSLERERDIIMREIGWAIDAIKDRDLHRAINLLERIRVDVQALITLLK